MQFDITLNARCKFQLKLYSAKYFIFNKNINKETYVHMDVGSTICLYIEIAYR